MLSCEMKLHTIMSVCVCVCACYCVCYSYRNLANEHETLMQKYLHLLQIVETEKTVAKQLRQQIEDGEIEIERLKSEVIFTVMPCTLNIKQTASKFCNDICSVFPSPTERVLNLI